MGINGGEKEFSWNKQAEHLLILSCTTCWKISDGHKEHDCQKWFGPVHQSAFQHAFFKKNWFSVFKTASEKPFFHLFLFSVTSAL